jgi:hypothetical protein
MRNEKIGQEETYKKKPLATVTSHPYGEQKRESVEERNFVSLVFSIT